MNTLICELRWIVSRSPARSKPHVDVGREDRRPTAGFSRSDGYNKRLGRGRHASRFARGEG